MEELDKKSLIEKAEATSRNAHSPYSNIKVGAAVATNSGKVYTGCNVENASYGLTCCAEQNAIYHAVAEEGSGLKIKAVAIHSDKLDPSSPCGSCRQVIAEFSDSETIIIYSNNGALNEIKADDLLPNSFSL
ncbi:cytidine deaminase [bacterium AH-315-C07]|nr:cytidine deaminase [bacterium AH-315-C07]